MPKCWQGDEGREHEQGPVAQRWNKAGREKASRIKGNKREKTIKVSSHEMRRSHGQKRGDGLFEEGGKEKKAQNLAEEGRRKAAPVMARRSVFVRKNRGSGRAGTNGVGVGRNLRAMIRRKDGLAN